LKSEICFRHGLPDDRLQRNGCFFYMNNTPKMGRMRASCGNILFHPAGVMRPWKTLGGKRCESRSGFAPRGRRAGECLVAFKGHV
jgi:hypothetical protein